VTSRLRKWLRFQRLHLLHWLLKVFLRRRAPLITLESLALAPASFPAGSPQLFRVSFVVPTWPWRRRAHRDWVSSRHLVVHRIVVMDNHAYAVNLLIDNSQYLPSPATSDPPFWERAFDYTHVRPGQVVRVSVERV
jgi:hypothetical protein